MEQSFERVLALGLALPNVEVTTKYDGSPLLKTSGRFMAGLALHSSAEEGTLVVRHGFVERDALIADAPETYYITDYYRPYELVLARLERIDEAALRELLYISWRMTGLGRRGGAGGRRTS